MTSEEAIRKYMNLICAQARHYSYYTRGFADYDDLVSVAMLGVHKAVQTYDATRGASFGTHASNMVAWELEKQRDYARAAFRGCRVDKLSIHAETDDDKPYEFPSAEPDPEQATIVAEAAHTVRGALGRLTAKQRRVVLARYYDDVTYEEVGSEMGTSKQAAQQLEGYALRAIRSHVREVA